MAAGLPIDPPHFLNGFTQMALNFAVPLFVPANRPERFAKAAAAGADAIVLDLEDAVAPEDKVAARNCLETSFTDLPVIVRINGPGTPWHQADMDAVLKLRPAAVMVPKAELNTLARPIDSLKDEIPMLLLVETARGLADARAMARMHGVKRLVFGSVDYCTDIGCKHTREALLAARNELVIASRLANLIAPVDGVTTAIDDQDLIAEDARYAQSLGFTGKLCIHPKQVSSIFAGLRPTSDEVSWAQRVLAAGEGGAIAVDGALVDEPVRIRARTILKLAGPEA